MTDLSPRAMADVVVDAAGDKKAEDILVLNVSELTTIADLFVICTGRGERQVQAIADAVREKAIEAGRKPIGVEGYSSGRWVLIDLGDVVLGHAPFQHMDGLEVDIRNRFEILRRRVASFFEIRRKRLALHAPNVIQSAMNVQPVTGLCLGSWQNHRHRRARFARADLDATGMGPNNVLRDRQAQPAAC